MHGKVTRARGRVLAAALFLGLAVTGARAQENNDADETQAQLPRSDAVYLLDVSGSMRKRDALKRAKHLLTELLDKVVQPGTQVAVIPFGTGVGQQTRYQIPKDAAGAAEQRDRMRETIGKFRPRDTYTYLFEAINESLATLMEFKQRRPGHSRHIILVSDGRQLIRRGDKSLTLDEILEHYGTLDFHPGKDWFIWYAHIGRPDASLKAALERTGAGQTIPLDRLSTLSWAVTQFDTNTIYMGRKLPGSWTHRARLNAQSDSASVGRKVLFDIVAKGLPEGMSLRLQPRAKKLTGPTTIFDVELICDGAQPGKHEATVLLNAEEGSLHWIEPKQMRLLVVVTQPKVTVSTETLSFGRIAPGAMASRTLKLAPNPIARQLPPQVELKLADVPEGFEVQLDRTKVEGNEDAEVAVTVGVPAGAEPGEYTCRVLLETGKNAAVVPSEVKVHYRVGVGRVMVGGDTLRFERVITGREVNAEVSLTPDDETARTGTQVNVEVAGSLPEKVDIEVPRQVRLEGLATLPVTVRVPRGMKGGTYQGELRLSAPYGIRVEPATLPITVTVVEASALMLPPVVDLGDVPASRAREIPGRFELAVADHQHGAELELVAADGKTAVAPRVVTLRRGTTELPIRLKTLDVGAGARTASFDVFYTQDGARSKVGTIAFRWRVKAMFLKVQNWSGPPAMRNGTSDAKASLVVESSQDLVGRKVHVAHLFDDLAPGMTVRVTPGEFRLDGGVQNIPVRLHVEGGRTGSYEGSLRLALARSLEGFESPTPVPVSLEVAGATVYLTREGGLEGLRHNSDRTVTLVLTASGVPAPVTLQLVLDRGGLPEAVHVDAPTTIQIAKPDGVTRVPLRFRMGEETPAGSWEPRVVVKASTDDLAVSPQELTLPADVPEPVTVVKERTFFEGRDTATALWVGIATGVVVLIGLAAFLLGRRGPAVVRVQVPQPVDLGIGAYEDDELVIEDDEALVHDVFGEEDP
ncbi:MAG: VWA domain-containing protein [Planctomycetota bacterium]|jgi:hypothetical protein